MMKKLALSLFKSADEKLRSLSHKGHHSSKTNTNTYCGSQNGQSDPSRGTRVTPSRSEAPDVPPPPIPIVTTNEIQKDQSHDLRPHHESSNQKRSSLVLQTSESDIPPPIFPKPHISNMAERKLHRQNRKGGEDSSVLKKRSRSEGPHGRRKLRNSMHETSNVTNQSKSVSNGRHSMYSGHLSDDDNVKAMHSGSDSPDSDVADQRWTKNPLMVRKSRKTERTSKTDKRRSMHNVESRNSFEQSGPSSYQVSQYRDVFIQPRKADASQSLSQKAKFQRMEENRKKRIDIAVTSDEECSPQLRISRLRQRAMMSSLLDNNQGHDAGINIVPVRSDSSFKAYRELQNGISQFDKSEQSRLSQYDENRQSKYDENYNIDNVNGNFYQEYTKQQGVKRSKLPNILPEFLPENRVSVNMSNRGYHGSTADQVSKTVAGHSQSVQPVNLKQEKPSGQKTQQGRVKLSSESPKLRSFNEVKANKPTQLKQADQKIELNPRSPNSSSDSLDDLIESNIQYLESEIESGKLKRQSGNYSNYPQENLVPRQVIREPLRSTQTKKPVQDEFRSRLQDPRTYVSNKLMSTVTNVEPKIVQKSAVYPQSSSSYSSHFPNSRQVSTTMNDQRHVPHSGSATYSPYMQRKTYDVSEDISKSDSHLNALNTEIVPSQNTFQVPKSYAPYPVLNKQTGNIMYVQPTESVEDQIQISENGMAPAIDTGMFSDVEYNIEVSERIKKWEKKLTPGEIEERRTILNTIKEYESFSDSNQKPDTPVEVRRELWQLVSPTNNSGVGKLSVNLTRSTSSMSDSSMQDPSGGNYFEPKVVSSETNLHRIFRVVNEPRPRRIIAKSIAKVKQSAESDDMVNAPQNRYRKPIEMSAHTQSMSNVTLSESEVGSNMQQSWPPMAVDSDSGIRKSWRMSRYEDEINELKELVSDNFRDIRKRFDSDMSETDTKRASPVLREPQIENSVTTTVPVTTQTSSGTSKLTLNIQPVTPTNPRSPVTIRRKLSDQRIENTQPVSPGIPLTPKKERRVPVYRNPSVETKPISSMAPVPKKAAVLDLKPPSAADSKVAPEVWSPNMESRKGLVSMERVKARTLQTIPFSEDPVWKEIEGLATFEKPEEISKEVNFDEIDELLKLATGGMDNLTAKTNNADTEFDNQMKRFTSSEPFITPSSTQVQTLMTQSYTPSVHMQIPEEKHSTLSDSTYPQAHSTKHVFTPPAIQPLKLNSKPSKKSSTSALDEVLEDIRATLQKKPLSPKLMKNFSASESNSSANPSLQSPLTKSSKAFIFPKDVKQAKTETIAENADVVKSSTTTPGYDNTHETWKPPQNEIPQQVQMQQMANVPYIDPEFTQFPYIINGNYHLDPKLLSEKLKSTGLVNDSSDEHSANRKKIFIDLPANHQRLSSSVRNQAASEIKKPETESQSKSNTHDLDQSVDDLRSLAQEVEHKLSQIKSRIVSADEDRLDSILLALRKFAPMTEQKFFNVKFTPNYESEKARRGKLEDALYELEKVYKSLDLDDKSLMDRASRREETAAYNNIHGQESSTVKNSSISNIPVVSNIPEQSSEIKSNVSDGSKILRRSQIEEIEKQTQSEFEDITKSFQVLLDEVTKQCRTVAQRSSKYFSSDSNLFATAAPVQQYSSQRPPDEIRQEPPRQQLKLETKTPRAVQDSYNTAIKELESVAMGNTESSKNKNVQSVLYLNIDKSKPSVQKSNQNMKNTNLASPTRNLDIQVQSKTVIPDRNVFNSKAPSESNKFVSMATEFFKPAVKKTVACGASNSEPNDVNKNSVSLQVELNNSQSRSRGAGRFRKRGNVEHRKSMPAITRSVETQTVETQTDPSQSVTEMKEKFEQYRKASLQEMSSDSSLDFKTDRKAESKISHSGENDVDISSSDDEPVGTSKMRRSFSCPDIVALIDELDRKEKDKEKKLAKVDKTNAKKGARSTTPKSVKQRHENKLRFRSLQKDDTKVKQTEITSSVNLDDGIESPKCKPPVYPVWKYPGQSESTSLKKTDQRKQAFGFDRDFTKTASDTEQDRVSLRYNDQGALGSDEVVIRRRSRSFGCEQDTEDRPKSFHELVATFEQNPQRREKMRASGLRKCASEDSVFTDLVLQKIYHSESDLYTDEKGHKLSGSALKLALEMKLKN